MVGDVHMAQGSYGRGSEKETPGVQRRELFFLGVLLLGNKPPLHLEIVKGGISNCHNGITPQEGGQLPPEPRPLESSVHDAVCQPH